MSRRKELIEITADIILNSNISRENLIAKLDRLIELEVRIYENYYKKRKTNILTWSKLSQCSIRLYNIISREAEHIYRVYGKDIYLEDVDKKTFLSWQGAGMKSWHEFIELRGDDNSVKCNECGSKMNIIYNCSNTKCFNYDP